MPGRGAGGEFPPLPGASRTKIGGRKKKEGGGERVLKKKIK